MSPKKATSFVDVPGVGAASTALAGDAALVLAAIQAEPGCSHGDVRQRTGLERRAIAAAVCQLVEEGFVHRIRLDHGVLLLPAWPGLGEHLGQLKALWCAKVRRLHRFLGHHEVCPHQRVVEHARQDWGWEVEATRWRLRGLERAGLVQAVLDMRDLRRVLYRYLPAHPDVHEVLASRPEAL